MREEAQLAETRAGIVLVGMQEGAQLAETRAGIALVEIQARTGLEPIARELRRGIPMQGFRREGEAIDNKRNGLNSSSRRGHRLAAHVRADLPGATMVELRARPAIAVEPVLAVVVVREVEADDS